ncbi:hypothetical protein TNCV_3230351 [Trichonephila clavipes]|nr:hypothetical protein TNCV_3230351 [Trichonephila clavipes]
MNKLLLPVRRRGDAKNTSVGWRDKTFLFTKQECYLHLKQATAAPLNRSYTSRGSGKIGILELSWLEKWNSGPDADLVIQPEDKNDDLRNPLKTSALKLFPFPAKMLIVEPMLPYILEDWTSKNIHAIVSRGLPKDEKHGKGSMSQKSLGTSDLELQNGPHA